MRMYRSPIEIIYGQMETQKEGDILRAVQKYGINVDKEELLRALQYDRNQYEKGYADGKADAMAELVRCKGCKFACEDHEDAYLCDNSYYGLMGFTRGDDFCSYGERKDNG
jgi:hypothetical protein